MNEHICKNNDKTLLMYRLIFPAEYRCEVFSGRVSAVLKDISPGISEQYGIPSAEIGMEGNYTCFLVRSVSALSVTQMVKTIKSITAKQIFQLHPDVKRFLQGEN